MFGGVQLLLTPFASAPAQHEAPRMIPKQDGATVHTPDAHFLRPEPKPKFPHQRRWEGNALSQRR